MSKARELSELGDKITVDGSGNSTFDGDVSAANLSTTGNITVSGTVDGRDVAADGAKLDGIEAGADVTDTANVTAAGALMDSEVTNLAAVKAFNPSDYATAAQGALADSATQPGDNISTLTNDAGYTTNVGDITGVTAGSGLTGGGTSGDVTVSHADTSTQASVNNSGTTVIQDVTLDTYGHVTGLASKTITSSDLGAAAYDTSTSSTGFFALPNGTTAQRPGSPANGYIRYNSTIGGIEEYNNGSWSTISQIFTGASGGSVTTSGGYTIHTFTSSGTFTVSGGNVNVEYLVIGGGGGGATQASSNNRGGGGGGAGGYRTNVSGQTSGGNSSAEGTKTLAIGSYTVTVGGGGAGGSGGYYVYGSSGSSSAFDNITSSGGGRGGHGNGGGPASGGSGGGGGSGDNPTNGASGTSGQGFGGGNGVSSGSYSGGTGGGAGGAGQNALFGIGVRRAGGAGLSSNITGSSVTRGVGGGSITADNEQSGAANTGNGGDGGGGTSAGSGGSGIVIIRYLTP